MLYNSSKASLLLFLNLPHHLTDLWRLFWILVSTDSLNQFALKVKMVNSDNFFPLLFANKGIDAITGVLDPCSQFLVESELLIGYFMFFVVFVCFPCLLFPLDYILLISTRILVPLTTLCNNAEIILPLASTHQTCYK